MRAALPLLLACAALPRHQLASAFDNGAPHSRLPPLGWSSWDALAAGADHPVRDFCDTVSVKAAADAYIETGLYDAGYRHLHLDDCWAGKQRNATGFIQPDPTRFPGGMKEVVEYVHAKNLTFGLYTSARMFCVGGRGACLFAGAKFQDSSKQGQSRMNRFAIAPTPPYRIAPSERFDLPLVDCRSTP